MLDLIKRPNEYSGLLPAIPKVNLAIFVKCFIPVIIFCSPEQHMKHIFKLKNSKHEFETQSSGLHRW